MTERTCTDIPTKRIRIEPLFAKAQRQEKTDSVEFAAFAPRGIAPMSNFILDIFAYLPHQYDSIVNRARELGRPEPLARKSGIHVLHGAILTINIKIDHLVVAEPVDTMIWEGEPVNTSFIISVPAETPIGSYPGRAFISYQGITIAKLVFLVPVAAEEDVECINQAAAVQYPRTAFASYASENRDDVLSRIQGMKKVAPDLDIFIDAISLRSGENWREMLEQHVPTKDTFYLFWSRLASGSEWVEREWRLALGRRGLEYIDPVPLEDPDTSPPPPELSALHFGDAYIAYIEHERVKKRMPGDI